VKNIVVTLLAVIAAGVGYLAYSKYRERQMITQVAEAIADPDAYLVKTWSKRAALRCDYGVYGVITRQAPAGAVPVRFLCRAATGGWVIAERECTEAERELSPGRRGLATGAPQRVGDVYKPLHVVCWEVVAKE
jgi:hypothetical protein